MTLPQRIFFTGVPGSRWSGIAQVLESLTGFNTSDRTPERDYTHHEFTGHKGAYFGRGMEFDHGRDAFIPALNSKETQDRYNEQFIFISPGEQSPQGVRAVMHRLREQWQPFARKIKPE